jgi:hydrogenase maturation protease
MKPSILIAGIGNIFLGDDAFGVEVVQAMHHRKLPGSVLVKDFGIRGFDLAYALLDPLDTVILVDAMPRGEAPGTLYTIEPDLKAITHPTSAVLAMDPHSMDPVRVLTLAASMGDITASVLVVGCEPQDFGDELEGRMGLSAPVQASVEEACRMVLELADRILARKAAQLEKPELKLCSV